MRCFGHWQENGKPTCKVIMHNFYMDFVIMGKCDTTQCPFYKPSSSGVEIHNEIAGDALEHCLRRKE